jgi:O-antigen ligase
MKTSIEISEKPLVKLLFPVFIGVFAVVIAISLESLEYKTAIAITAGLFIGGIAIYFLNQKAITYISIFTLGMGIPFNLDVNLFFRPYIGVTSVDIGVTFLSSVVLYAVFYYEHIVNGIKRFHSNRMLLFAMLLYMGSGLLSLYNAASKELVVLELVRLTILLAIFYTVMNFGRREYISVFIVTLSICVFLEFLLAYYQYKTGRLFGLYAFGETRYEFGVGYLDVRASGTFSHANGLAYFFELLLPLVFAMFIVEENKLLKLWYIFAFLFGFFGLVITLSRGGWLATAISLPIVFFVLFRNRITQQKYIISIFLGLIAVVILGFFFYPTIAKRIQAYDYGSAASRRPLNLAAMSIIKQYPVTGVGMNNFAQVFRVYDTTGGSSIFKARGLVHNLFLGVWTETGIIGIISFLWIFLSAFIVSTKLLTKVPFWYSGVLVGVSAGLFAQFIHGMFDPGFRVLMSTSMLVYSMIGLIGAVSVLYKTKEKQLLQ